MLKSLWGMILSLQHFLDFSFRSIWIRPRPHLVCYKFFVFWRGCKRISIFVWWCNRDKRIKWVCLGKSDPTRDENRSKLGLIRMAVHYYIIVSLFVVLLLHKNCSFKQRHLNELIEWAFANDHMYYFGQWFSNR